jgi:ABC-type phosphate transport system permease subunit
MKTDNQENILFYTKLVLLMLTIVVIILSGYVAELATEKLKSIQNFNYNLQLTKSNNISK